MSMKIKIGSALALGIALGFSASAGAQGVFQNNFSADEARKARQERRVMGAAEALRIVQNRYPDLRTGDARLQANGANGPEYHVKMISRDNKVIYVVVDARSGRIIRATGGN